MSFLDNLENNLKALENREERDPVAERKKRDDARARELAIAPWAEKLKNSDFTKELLNEAAMRGHQRRAKTNMTWLGQNLRLEIKENRLDLQPESDGVVAVFSQGGEEKQRQKIDLSGSPAALLDQWLG